MKLGMKKIALIMSMTFFSTSRALALDCAAIDDQGALYYRENVVVDNVLIPENSKDNQKIWNSKTYDRNVVCTSNIAESVYFYFFPYVKPENLPKGMIFGITYLGQDYDLDITVPQKDRRIKTNISLDGKKETKASISVQLYIKKSGKIDTQGFSGSLNIYQLDGSLGLHVGNNYQFSLSNLDQIIGVTCDSSYSWNNFDVTINNELTLSPQTISNIGNLNLSCSTTTPVNLKDKKVTLAIYPDKNVSTDKFTTSLDELNFTFNVAGQEVTPHNSATNPQKISVFLDNQGKITIPVNGLFKLDYQPPGENWLYDSKTSTFIPANINILSELILIE